MGKKYIIDLNPDCVEGEYLRIPARIAGEEQWLVTKAALTPYTEPDLEQVRADAYNDGYKSGREAEKVRQPDLERVKADAYLKGLNDGQGVILESTQNNAFNNGYKKCLEDMEHDKGKENSIGYKIGYKKGYIDGLNRISDYEDKIRKEAYEEGYKTAKIQCGIQAEKDMREVGERHYQRGLADAWEAARKIIHMPEGDLLNIFTECYSAVCTALQVVLKYDASECIEKIRAYEQEKEEIKVGDEVELKCGVRPAIYMQGTKGSDEIYLLFNDGSCGLHSKSEIVRKTGRHFHEIATILENMRGEQDG